MVRFKVFKGSHLLLAFAVILLILVIGGLIITNAIAGNPETVGVHANLVTEKSSEIQSEAEIDTIFASLSLDSSAIELDPEMNGSLSIEILPPPTEHMPRVLIYHTHTHEAYEQVDHDRYVAIEAWRTNDKDHSVVRVGRELAELLRERGFYVVHDTTDHEQDELGTAYTRSLDTLEAYDQKFDLYIDLHRDAYIEGVEYEQIMHQGQALAQLMLLVGNGKGFEVKPYYAENLAFASHLTARINQQIPELCKDVLVKDGRYNQNIGVFSILVEVGHNKNTLQEALNALPYLADGIRSLLIDKPVDELTEIQRTFHSSYN